MARPKKKKEDEKNNRITIRFTDMEMEEIRKLSGRNNLSVSEYVREQVSRGKIDVYYNTGASIDEIKPLTEEFHKIGINLNQIAHHLNAGGALTPAIKKEIEKRVYELHKLAEKANDFLEK